MDHSSLQYDWTQGLSSMDYYHPSGKLDKPLDSASTTLLYQTLEPLTRKGFITWMFNN